MHLTCRRKRMEATKKAQTYGCDRAMDIIAARSLYFDLNLTVTHRMSVSEKLQPSRRNYKTDYYHTSFCRPARRIK